MAKKITITEEELRASIESDKNKSTGDNEIAETTKITGEPDTKVAPAKRFPFNITRKQGISGLVLLLVIVLGFVGGLHYEKSHQRQANMKQTAMRGGRFSGGVNGGFGGGYGQSGRTGGRNGAMRGGVFGQVTAVSATSVTVQNARTGSASALTISSSTTVTNNGQTAAISDIKTGDNVLVRTSTTDTKQAVQIMLNPQVHGRGGMGSTSQSQSTPPTPIQTN